MTSRFMMKFSSYKPWLFLITGSLILFIALAHRDAGIPSGALMSTCQLCAGAIIIIGSVHVECAAHRMAVYQSAPSNSCATRYHRVTIVRFRGRHSNSDRVLRGDVVVCRLELSGSI